MLVSKFGLAVFAAITSLVPSTFAQDDDNSNDDISQSVQSTFVSPDGSLTFGFSWPDDGTDDIYFALRVRRAVAWGAVGLGSDDMPGALYLMIYENHDGDDVNFSPRLSEGHYEPQYHGDIHVERMPGTTINKKDMLFVGRCTNCLNWPSFHGQGGNINLTSTTETCIYGFGPDEGFATDNVQEGIKFHEQYGVFEIDMNRTRGATEPPRADRKLRSDGTRLIRHVDGAADVQSIVHGIVMMFCFVGLMPLGIVILRFGGWARWHAINQTVAMVGVLVGFALGIVVSFRYQRSRGFNAAHQVVGMLATAFILGQFALGFLHHRKFKQTHQPTRYGTTHLWFGRAIIVLGIMNAFFGLTFALNRRYGIVLGAIVIFVILCALAFIIGRRWLDNRRLMRGNVRPSTRHSRGPYAGGMPAGQYRPPSRQAQPAQRSPHERRATHQTSHRDIEHDPSDPPPSYETSSSSQTISLGPMNPQRGQERKEEVRETTTSTQSPREFS